MSYGVMSIIISALIRYKDMLTKSVTVDIRNVKDVAMSL
jgi:hypothetical protein